MFLTTCTYLVTDHNHFKWYFLFFSFFYWANSRNSLCETMGDSTYWERKFWRLRPLTSCNLNLTSTELWERKPSTQKLYPSVDTLKPVELASMLPLGNTIAAISNGHMMLLIMHKLKRGHTSAQSFQLTTPLLRILLRQLLASVACFFYGEAVSRYSYPRHNKKEGGHVITGRKVAIVITHCH